jgi:hypothetical protein
MYAYLYTYIQVCVGNEKKKKLKKIKISLNTFTRENNVSHPSSMHIIISSTLKVMWEMGAF